ncbi:MAG: dockerin type I domain-containing protein, partial [Rubripirellula sp.]
MRLFRKMRATDRRRPKPSHRRLRSEALEARRLLAGDVMLEHNFRYPEDVNGDGGTTSLDALIVINRIIDGAQSTNDSVDVNGDGNATVEDALMVLNNLVSNSQGSVMPVADRIDWLTNAISNDRFAGDQAELDAAVSTLATLRAGTLPELATDNTPIPVEPDGGIGDGAGPIPNLADGPTTDVDANDIPMEQDPDDVGTPIPVEPDGGIGDGAGPIPDLADGPPTDVDANDIPMEQDPDDVGTPIPVEPAGGIGDG